MRLVHIITSLGDGGAEHTLFKICKYDSINKHFIISLKGPDKYSLPLKKLGVKVYYLDIKLYSVFAFINLLRLIKLLKPNIVQTWLAHGDLIGGIAAKLCGFKNIVWNIRYSNFKIGEAKLTTIFLIKILTILSSYIPKLVILNSKSAKKIYIRQGYDKKKLTFIPNGYDKSILKPHTLKKNKKKIPIIGNVARYDPKKDHLNLIKAISILKSKKTIVYCYLYGHRIDKKNYKLISQIKKFKLSNQVKLIGQKKNITKVMNQLDIYVQSSSYGEGFPNVVAEAMMCKIPCIVTNSGDSKNIVGDTGWVVPPKNPKKLALALEKALIERNTQTKNWSKRKNKARQRIIKYFDINKMIILYRKLWLSLMHEK